ncbi:MAG: hypothetical protein AAF806_07755 [Bacteroidota bacterium]
MRNVLLLGLILVAATVLFGQIKAMEIPMTADHWQFEEGNVKFVKHLGVDALHHLKDDPMVIAKNIEFENGTIEFDLDPIGKRFASIYFPRENDKETWRGQFFLCLGYYC